MKKISRRNFLKTCAIAGSAAALTGLRRLFQHDFWQRRKYLPVPLPAARRPLLSIPVMQTYPAVWLAASRASISLPVASIWTSGLTRMKRPTPSLPAATCRM